MTSTTTSTDKKIFNVNVGVLGHVDSGKTSLSKALSSVASTAAFDKHPQSQERGITLDLGFSCFFDFENVKSELFDGVQYTLVDCPGHATLIRTIIGGAQIIDVMILVIDIQKGVQTQTAECIVIGEITCNNLIVLLNKVDMIPEAQRKDKIEKMTRGLLKQIFASTRFPNPPIIPISTQTKEGLDTLIKTLATFVKVPKKEHPDIDPNEKFLYAVDHCFPIKGKGTVLTGTVLQGKVEVNQTIELPSLNEQRKVKSIQMFKRPVQAAYRGDRVGILVTQLESEKFERGFAADVGLVKTIHSVFAKVEKIRFYKKAVESKAKFHVSIGHSTVMGQATIMELIEKEGASSAAIIDNLDNNTFLYATELPDHQPSQKKQYYARIDLETPIPCYPNARFIASKLDSDIHANVCRLAFHGVMLPQLNADNTSESLDKTLQVFKLKEKTAQIDRIVDAYSLIAKNIVKKKITAEYLTPFIGKKIVLELSNNSESPATEIEGVIDSSFGATGKFKVRFYQQIPTKIAGQTAILRLKYKVNIYDKSRKWIQ